MLLPLCDVGHGIAQSCALWGREIDRGRFMSGSVSPPILNVTLLDEEASFRMVRDKVPVGNIEGIHMSGLRIKTFKPFRPRVGRSVSLLPLAKE